jgi:hypothetical protein
MQTSLDRFLFTQVGLDSGMLTMLGAVIHSFGDAGEYRGTVRTTDGPEATFYVGVDKNCAVAQVNIDLARLAGAMEQAHASGAPCAEPRFIVYPKGYAVFHVGSGPGGYSVNVRRAVEDPDVKAYDSRELQPGDIFSAMLLRPGVYSMRNLSSSAQGELTVAYPVIGQTAFRPPPPINVECGEGFDPGAVQLQPSQGINFHVKAPARIKIELVRADDGPTRQESTNGTS